jgi:Holliday junction resolvase RusA-like endonuclease
MKKLSGIYVTISAYFQREVPLYLDIKAFYKIPKSVSKTVRQKMINGEILPIVKPDFDNVEKMIADAMNKKLYADDAQINESHFKKVYGEDPRVEILIRSIGPEPEKKEKPAEKKKLDTKHIEALLKKAGEEWQAKRGLRYETL